jgi:hypothetical protein
MIPAPEGPADGLPFNRVFLKVGDRRRELRVSEFLELPLTQRIEAILRRVVEFYDGSAPVSRHVALSALRVSRAK